MFSARTTDELVLEINEIADRFGLTAKDFNRYRNLGLILVTVEAGSNEHDGITRLTCQFGNRVWQAVVGGDKRVVHEEIRYCGGSFRGRRVP